MKKLLGTLILFMPVFLFGQFENIRVSILNGPTFSWMTTDDNTIETQGARIGYKLHIQGEYLLNDRFSLTGGLGLSLAQGGQLLYNKGGNLWSESKLNIPRGDSLPNGVELGYRVGYVDFPFGFKMRTNEFGRFKFYAHMPEFSLGIRTHSRGSIEGIGVSTTDEQIKSQIPFINISWGLGLGTEYRISDNISLTGGLRFFQSITDVTDDDGRYFDGSKENSKGKFNNIDLRIGVLF
ncbi:MAG: outer membrane beta-barrel protein [Saprospiraceae bacterium]|nr:outer membrane beta-barrel protein [Candidatus Vicinibacter affinis]MBK7800129.1 outer membrane beta-barrel protein [Candidatus Vicinibacter affinis]MBK8642406.1 outer membrane beta-barrel protein [Candidatus Vicinibacter affinis]